MTGFAVFVTLRPLPRLFQRALAHLELEKQFRHRQRVRASLIAPIQLFPKDAFVVLFDPLPINAHGSGEWLEALENTAVVAVVVLTSLR
jgi:hypothetical protein